MDVTLEYNKDTETLLCKLTGEWDWEIFYETFDQYRSHKGDLETRYVIVDVLGISSINSDAVLNLKRAAGWAAEEQQRFYIVITNRYVRTIYYVFLRIYPNIASRFSLVSTVAEARALIAQDIDA